MAKPIIGRIEEIEILRAALKSDLAEFVTVIGRRRVGKTYMIKRTYQGLIDFELTGLQNVTKSEQLQSFVYAFAQYFPDLEIKGRPKSWLDAFYILSQALSGVDKQEKIVVFLDELPWLGTKRSGFLQGLSWFWNSWATNQNIVLVGCGSAASWMIRRIINNKGGLHNRVTQIISLFPFTLGETEAFLKLKNVQLNRYQITQLYLVMGGIPMYLNQVKPGLSAVQNIHAICFKQNGYLREEFDRLFPSLFDNSEKHIEVVRVLASKKMGMTRQELIARSRFSNGGMFTTILNELAQSGFLTKYNGYGKKSRLSLYRLSDPFSLFYLAFMEPLGFNARLDFTKLSDLPKYRSWSGYAFENVCLNHIDQIRVALGISGITTTVSSFYSRPEEGFPGTQIDLLIDRGDQSINLCEIKYSISDYEVTKRDVENLDTKKRVFRYHTKSRKHIFTSLITTFGVMDNANRLNSIDQVVILDALFTLV